MSFLCNIMNSAVRWHRIWPFFFSPFLGAMNYTLVVCIKHAPTLARSLPILTLNRSRVIADIRLRLHIDGLNSARLLSQTGLLNEFC